MKNIRKILAEEGFFEKEAVRRLVRPSRAYRTGQFVRVDGDASGDYMGRVIRRIPQLRKPSLRHVVEQETQPGFLMEVWRWEGHDLSPDEMYEIEAWDSEVVGPWSPSL